MMPRLDGFELLKALRTNERTREIPVVLLSARAGEDSRIEGLDAGADDYLLKPFSARELWLIQSLPPAEAAKRTGRTLTAVYSQRSRLGVMS